MPMIPMGDDQMMEEPMGPAVAPGPGGEGPDAMMDQAPPDPAEMAQMLGETIAQQREQAHMMVDQAADEDLQQIIGMILQAGQAAQVTGPGMVA